MSRTRPGLEGADFAEGAAKNLLRGLAVAAENFLIGLHHAARRVEKAFAVRVVADPCDQRARGSLRLFARGTLYRGQLGCCIRLLQQRRDDGIHLGLLHSCRSTPSSGLLLSFAVRPPGGGAAMQEAHFFPSAGRLPTRAYRSYLSGDFDLRTTPLWQFPENLPPSWRAASTRENLHPRTIVPASREGIWCWIAANSRMKVIVPGS